ncbi:major facilitator superfamily domain-containing protein, partial [Piptocephalis cylindrospora]
LFSILAGTLVSVFGFRPILLLGSAIASAGYLTASFVDYPLLLIPTQGIMVGLGGALIFTPLLAVPSHWFMRKRALVAGICVAGAGLGGLTMAAVVERLLHVVGLNWTLRILSVLLFSVGTICSFLIRPRLPSRQETIFRWSTLDGVWTLRFLYLAGTVALFYLIDFIPLFILPAYSLSLGENEEKSALVLGILNITQAIGRIASGWVGDRFGRINTLALILGASSIVCFALWLPASDYGTLMAFACIFGIFSGGVISLAVSIIPDLYGILGMIVSGWIKTHKPNQLSLPFSHL